VSEPPPFDFASAEDVALYDEVTLWSSQAGQLLLESVTIAGVRRVLDLGCGAGFPLVELAERLGPEVRVVGLDPWAPALARARAKLVRWGVRNAWAVRGDAVAMPFPEACFDLIVSNLGVNNFESPNAALHECRRVLKPGGILGLSSNVIGHMRELYAAFERVVGGDDAARGRLRDDMNHRTSEEKLRALLEPLGFRVTMVRRREIVMRFASAAALYAHHFVRLGFRAGWEQVAGADGLKRLGAELDRIAAKDGALNLTIPLIYVEARTAGGA
jgi:SAM-dependent methyltransferase